MPERNRINEDFPSGSRRVRHQAITNQLTRITGRLGQLAAQFGLSPAAEHALRHDAALKVGHRKWLALAENGGDLRPAPVPAASTPAPAATNGTSIAGFTAPGRTKRERCSGRVWT